jgi:hypothetical protein
VPATPAASFPRIGPGVPIALPAALLTVCLTEVVLISLQAWPRVPSQVNFESTVDAAVDVVLVAGAGCCSPSGARCSVLAAAAARARADAAPPVRAGGSERS